MPTVSGVWKWNDVISAIPGKSLYINFTSNSKSFIQMIVERDVAGNVLFYVEDATTTYVDAYNLYDNTWTNEAYKTIDFGSSPQEVSQNFYDYLTANATKQEDPVGPTTTKTVSSDNLARFKQKCDETYAKNSAYALQEASGGGGTISGHTVTVEQDALAGVSSPSIVFEKADGTTQTVTSSASSIIVNNVVKIWASIGGGGNNLAVSGGINVLTSFMDANTKFIFVYSVYGDGEITMGGIG